MTLAVASGAAAVTTAAEPHLQGHPEGVVAFVLDVDLRWGAAVIVAQVIEEPAINIAVLITKAVKVPGQLHLVPDSQVKVLLRPRQLPELCLNILYAGLHTRVCREHTHHTSQAAAIQGFETVLF